MIVLFSISCTSVEDFFKNQVTVYPVLITKDEKPLPLNRTTYKVFPESQVVIYWMPDFEFPGRKLAKCIVRDRLNWSGEYEDGSAKFMMVNGKFVQVQPVDEDIQYISWWKWYLLHIGLNFN
jgi:hypothetical protein